MYVGNTLHNLLLQRPCPNHPHVCREHLFKANNAIKLTQPSPRMWGMPPLFSVLSHTEPTIPTYVGSTLYMMMHVCRYANHSHACGEHTGFECPAVGGVQPSPRIWGTLRPSPRHI